MTTVSEDELLLQRAVAQRLLTKEQLGRCVAAQRKLVAAGRNVPLSAIARAAKLLTQAQFDSLKKSLDKEEAIPRLGGFEILGRIGKGGMGYVFKARQVSMDRIVALKILPPRMATDKSFVERFRREAKAAARLNHTNIIQSIDVGEQEGHHYFAMEFVEGPTADEILTKSGRIEENLAIDIVLQMARAIQAAEKLKIVHLDIKPSNIMITADRVAKLADFGLARRLTDDTGSGKPGIVFGTPEYISPEQALGRKDLDSRSDIYSLGATFYQMLTGEPPFKGATPREIVDKRLSQPPKHPKQVNPNLSDQVCQVLDKMLQRDRNFRYQNASELIEDLEFIQRSRQAQTVWPMAFMQQAASGAPQGEVLYEEVSSIVGPTALRRQRGPSPAAMIMGTFALLVLLGFGASGAYIYLKEPVLWAKIMKFLGAEEKRRRPAQGARQIGAPPAPVAPMPIAPLPPAPAPTTSAVAADADKWKAQAEACLAEAKKLVAAGDLTGALKVLDKFPKDQMESLFGLPLKELRAEIETKIRTRANRDIADARQLRIDGKLAESRALLEKVKAYLPESFTDEYADYEDAMQKLDEREKRAGVTPPSATGADGRPAEKAAEKPPEKAVDLEKMRAELRTFTTPLVEAGQYDEAIKKIELLLAAPDYASARAELELERADVARVKGFAAALAEGATNLVGQIISVKGIGGYTLRSLSGPDLIVELDGKELSPQKVRDLKPRELLAIAQGSPALKSKPEAEQHLMCALYLLARKQPEKASFELEAAKKAGLDVSRYAASAPSAPAPSKKPDAKKKPADK
jgi:serine/threonine-protein kinase